MIAMKYYTSTTKFNCGIDLHARQMYVCVMDRDGKKLVHTNVRNKLIGARAPPVCVGRGRTPWI
jgi:hypothetical protein